MLSAMVVPDTSKAESEFDAAFALLKVASDPATFNKRLHELDDKAKAVQAALKKAKAETAKAEAFAKAASETNAATEKLKQELSTKEAELAQREQALTTRTARVVEGEKAAAEAQEKYNQTVETFAKRERAMKRLEAESAKKIAHNEEVAAAQLAEKSAALDVAHKARMDQLAKQEHDMQAAIDSATAEKAAAEKLRLTYQDKLAKLKNIIG